MVWKAANVWVQNLTACNFLSGKGDAGNEIWWNGGDGSGKIGGHGYYGSYLTATNTFFRSDDPGAVRDLLEQLERRHVVPDVREQLQRLQLLHRCLPAAVRSDDQQGPRRVQLTRLLGDQLRWPAGGQEFRIRPNQDGFDTDSENGDAPSPQNGACPNNAVSPITHTHSCWVLMDNYIHDNNNPNVPVVGQAGSTPLGVGLSLSGARNDTVMHNRIVRNDAWGVLIQVQQGEGGRPCIGGTLNFNVLGITLPCLFDGYGNAILKNSFADNGSYGHATNGDIASLNFESGNPVFCYRGNTDPGGLTTSPAGLEQTYPACTGAPGRPTRTCRSSRRSFAAMRVPWSG